MLKMRSACPSSLLEMAYARC